MIVMMKSFQFVFLFMLLGLRLSLCTILLRESFESYEDYWDTDINGITGHVARMYEPNQDTMKYLATNTTNCPGMSLSCYRAELKITQPKRSLFFPSSSTELWHGFSARIPSDWVWTGGSNDITAYIMQIHGGDNLGQGPIFGLRNKGTKMDISICGNELYSSPTSTCSYYPIGNVNAGVWENWVVHDVFSHDKDKPGSVQVWRNGVLVLNVTNLLTSYNDINPHYLKIGTYVLQWKTSLNSYPSSLIQWVGVDYQYMIIGDANASFEDVFSWAGTPLPTTTPTTQPARTSVSGQPKLLGFTRNIAILVAAAVGLAVLLCCIALIKCVCMSSESKSVNLHNSHSNNAASTKQGNIEMGTYTPAATADVAIIINEPEGVEL
jgi:hypothetical protein